jgi:hypothetical protein
MILNNGEKRRFWMWLAPALGLVLALTVGGCLKVKDRLTINADGSGSILLETESLLPAGNDPMNVAGMAQEYRTLYPPMDRYRLSQLLPDKDFTIKMLPRSGSGQGLKIEATFKDINRLLESPYGKAHSLSMVRVGGELFLTARTGLQAPARMVDHMGEFMADEIKAGGGVKTVEAAKKLAIEFTIVMPAVAKVGMSNPDFVAGAVASGNTVTWTVDYAKAKDAAEAAAAFDNILTVRCPDADVKFQPVDTPRLDLAFFKDLKDRQLVAAPVIDEAKVLAAAKVVPVRLEVTRSFDLAGSMRNRPQNSAQLSVVALVPKALAPRQFGMPVIKEARDDLGTNLILPEGGYYRDYSDEWDEEGQEGAKEEAEVIRQFQITLKTPPAKAKSIASIKASIDLQYPGAQHLVRLEGAIPKASLVAMPDEDRSRQADPIVNPRLKELGVELVSRVSVENGVTRINLVVESKKADVTQVQVFDKDGRPWPTITNRANDGGSGQPRVLVAGRPEGPLSLAVVVQEDGPKVTLPIEIKGVPLTGGADESAKPKTPGKPAAAKP